MPILVLGTRSSSEARSTKEVLHPHCACDQHAQLVEDVANKCVYCLHLPGKYKGNNGFKGASPRYKGSFAPIHIPKGKVRNHGISDLPMTLFLHITYVYGAYVIGLSNSWMHRRWVPTPSILGVWWLRLLKTINSLIHTLFTVDCH